MSRPIIHLDRISIPFTGWAGQVIDFASLPPAVDHAGEYYMVLTATGSRFLLTYKASGLYRSDGASWVKMNDVQMLLDDDQFSVYNSVDNTKIISFDVSGISTGTKRTATWPDKDGTVAFISDVEAADELSEVLSKGNTTGGTAISITSGDYIQYNEGIAGSRLTSETITSVPKVWSLPDQTGTIALTSDIVNADWNAISGDAEILNKPTDVTDLSVHSVTELNDVTNAGSGVIISSAERTNLSNQSGVNTGDEVQATETVSGIAEIATQVETDAGTDDLRIVTPLKLKSALSTAPKILTSITGINGKVVGLTNLYTVPAGKKVMVSEIFIEPTAITGAGDGPKISIGTNATTHDNIIAVTDMKTLKLVGDLFSIDTEGLFKRADAAQIIKINNSAIAGTTTYVYTAHLIGYEI